MKTPDPSQALTLARKLWPTVTDSALENLSALCAQHGFSVARGDLLLVDRGWYVTHTGLLALARRHRCAGIIVKPLEPFCMADERTWAFEATVYKSKTCRGFSGMGDASPATVPQHLWGCEMRIAETRAVNRALRKAYAVGLCSVEELSAPKLFELPPKKLPMSTAGIPGAEPRSERDRLIAIIRQYHLDGELVKRYAMEELGVSALKEADHIAVRHFITRLGEEARVSLEELRCKLNGLRRSQEVS